MNKDKDFLGTEPVGKLMFRLALPTITAQLINMLYNIIDRIYIGHIPGNGALALTGVGVCMPLIMIISAFAALVGGGGAPHASIAMGKNDLNTAEHILGNCFFLQILISIILTVILLFGNRTFLLAFGASENTIEYAVNYMNIYAVDTIFVQLTLGMNMFITTQGFAKTGMLSVLIGAVMNIVLDPLFIFTLDMGTAGAALATGLSQFISFCILLWMCNHQDSCISISIRKFRPKLAIYREVLYGGIPSLGRQGIASVATILMNFMCQPYGDAAIAAMSIVSRFMFFINSVIIGFGQGFQPVCSYCFGAGLYDRVKKACWFCIRVSTIILLVLSVISFPAARSIITLFRRNDPTVIEIGTLALRLQLITLPLQGAVIMGNMMPQSIGYGFRATLVSTARQGIFLIPLLTIMTYTIGLLGIQCAQPLADIATFILSLFVIRGIFKEFPEDASSFAAQ